MAMIIWSKGWLHGTGGPRTEVGDMEGSKWIDFDVSLIYGMMKSVEINLIFRCLQNLEKTK